MLSDVQASAAKAGEKDYKLADANGLYLFVTRSGFKSWRMKYRFAGKEKRLTFGSYPEVSLAEARARRDEARGLLRDQIDPALERQRRREGGVPPVLEPAPYVDDDVDNNDQAAMATPMVAPAVTPRPVEPATISVPEFVPAPARPEAAEDEPSDVTAYTPDLVVGSRALSLLKQAEVAAEAAAYQSRRATRLGYVVIGLLLIGALALALWLLAGHRHAGSSIHVTMPAATAVSAPPGAVEPSIAMPTPAVSAPAQPMVTNPLPATSPTATVAPAYPARPTMVVSPHPRGRHHHRHRRARHHMRAFHGRAPRSSARGLSTVRSTTPGASARSLSQETSRDIQITAPRAQAVDPALDRAGRSALCLRAAYSADPSCAAVRRAGGFVGAAEADAGGGAPRQ